MGTAGAKARPRRAVEVRQAGDLGRQGGVRVMSEEGQRRPGATAAAVGAPRGLGSRTDKQGRQMIGAEAVVASLEARGRGSGVRLSGRPGHQDIRRALRFDADHPRARAPRAGRGARGRRLRAGHGQRGRGRCDQRPGRHEHGHGHRDGLHGQRAARGDHGPGATRRHRHGLVPGVRHRGHHHAGGQAQLPSAVHRRAHRARFARRSTSPRRGVPARSSSTCRATWPPRRWCSSTPTT